jgi:hypothetical protein
MGGPQISRQPVLRHMPAFISQAPLSSTPTKEQCQGSLLTLQRRSKEHRAVHRPLITNLSDLGLAERGRSQGEEVKWINIVYQTFSTHRNTNASERNVTYKPQVETINFPRFSKRLLLVTFVIIVLDRTFLCRPGWPHSQGPLCWDKGVCHHTRPNKEFVFCLRLFTLSKLP